MIARRSGTRHTEYELRCKAWPELLGLSSLLWNTEGAATVAVVLNPDLTPEMVSLPPWHSVHSLDLESGILIYS